MTRLNKLIVSLLCFLFLASDVYADQFFGGGNSSGGISGLEIGTTTVTGGTSNCLLKESGGALACSSMTDDGTAVTSTVPIQASDGSAAAPSIAFASDTDKGFYHISDNILGYAVGGILRHQFNPTQIAITSSTGSVVIGGDTALSRAGAGVVGVTTGIAIGTNPAQSGAVRLAHGSSISVRNSANTVDNALVSYGVRAVDQIALGATNRNTRISSNLATPASALDGDWWVECSGTSPSRTCSINVRDSSVTQVIATTAAF